MYLVIKIIFPGRFYKINQKFNFHLLLCFHVESWMRSANVLPFINTCTGTTKSMVQQPVSDEAENIEHKRNISTSATAQILCAIYLLYLSIFPCICLH